MNITKEQLREAFDRHGTDKGGLQHDYALMYNEVFGLLSKCDRMLEIGFGAGRSGLAWRDLLPDTELTLLDKVRYDGTLEEAKSLNLWIGDSARASIVSSLFAECHPFDLIIDDGDHRPDYQFQTFINFEPWFKSVYVIEDIIGIENEKLLRRRLNAHGYANLRTYSSKHKNGRIRMNGKMTDVSFYAMVVFAKDFDLNGAMEARAAESQQQ